MGDAIITRKNGIDVSDANATASAVLEGNTFYAGNDDIKTGTIPSMQATIHTPGTVDMTIASGRYLAGDQTIKGDVNLVAGNIKSGVSIFGVQGAIPLLPAKTYTPSNLDQNIAKGQYIDGIQTIKGDTNLLPGNIKKGISIFGVSGNLESFFNGKISAIAGTSGNMTVYTNNGQTLSVPYMCIDITSILNCGCSVVQFTYSNGSDTLENLNMMVYSGNAWLMSKKVGESNRPKVFAFEAFLESGYQTTFKIPYLQAGVELMWSGWKVLY